MAVVKMHQQAVISVENDIFRTVQYEGDKNVSAAQGKKLAVSTVLRLSVRLSISLSIYLSVYITFNESKKEEEFKKFLFRQSTLFCRSKKLLPTLAI
jgi:hypothetical protein